MTRLNRTMSYNLRKCCVTSRFMATGEKREDFQIENTDSCGLFSLKQHLPSFLFSAVAGLKLLGGPNLHFYCSTLVFNIYFLEFAKLLGGPGPPRPLPTLRHCCFCYNAYGKWLSAKFLQLLSCHAVFLWMSYSSMNRSFQFRFHTLQSQS